MALATSLAPSVAASRPGPRRRLSAALAAAALLLAACATPPGPPPSTPVAPALPSQWAGPVPPGAPAAQTAADRDWWQGFDDPLLPALVDEALAGNLDLQTAQTTLARARALRDAARAAEGPSLGTGASAGRTRSGGQTGNALRVGLDASWEADLFGANAAATVAAQADADAAAATLQATRLSVAAETAIAYLQWQGLRAQRAAAATSLDSQRQTLELVQWRQRAGLVSSLDLEQAQSSVDSARARLSALDLQQTQAGHALALLLGRPPAALAERLNASAPGQATAPALPALPQPAALLQRRYDLQAAQQRIGAQLATLNQRQAERRPSFSLSGNLALQAATLSALGGSGALVAGLAAAVDWTLFDGGAGAARVAAQQAALDSARLDWQAALLVALQDVEDGLAALARQRERVDALTRAASAADEALRLARISYEAGLSDFLTLLDSERSALSAADSLATTRSDYAAAHVRLYKALGGAWATGTPPAGADGAPVTTAPATSAPVTSAPAARP